MKITEANRQQVAAEKIVKAQGMSEVAKAKLRALTEHNRKDTDADSRLVKEFNSGERSVESLTDLFAKSFGGANASPRRRAVKAAYRLNQGMRVYHLHDLSLFGELLPDESEMPMAKFLARYPLPESETAIPKQDLPEVKYCALGVRKCLKVKNKKAGVVYGTSEYCSPDCRGRAKIINRKAQIAKIAFLPVANAPEVQKTL